MAVKIRLRLPQAAHLRRMALKKIIALLIVLAVALPLAACGGTGLEGFMANHKVAFDRKGEDGSVEHMTEYVCEGNYAHVADDFIVYVKSGAEDGNRLYLLDPAEKRGFSVPAEDISSETDFLEYDFEPYRALGAKKNGSGKIAGRAVDIFFLEHDGDRLKFWVDKKSGITLKRAKVDDAGEELPDADGLVFPEVGTTPYCFEVTEIQVGGVTPADMVNLEDYTILSAGDLIGNPFGNSFDAAFFDAFGNAFGNSFGEAFGGMLGGELGEALGGALGDTLNALEEIGNALGDVIGKIFR